MEKRLAKVYQDFTPKEEACISREISQAKNEGISQDQAIAKAIGICAPEKQRGRTLITRKQMENICPECAADMKRRNIKAFKITYSGHTTKERKKKSKDRGGRYRSHMGEDGKWTIFDVPIFAAHEIPEEDTEIGPDYLKAAVQYALYKSEHEDFLAPLHRRHHYEGNETELIGRILPRRVAMSLHDGVEVPTIFSDLKEVSDEHYEDIVDGKLAYRSVEIPPDLSDQRILSLALLPDEAPYFSFPLLTIGEETRSFTPDRTVKTDSTPVLAYHVGQGRTILYKEADMARKYVDDREVEEVLEVVEDAEEALEEAVEETPDEMGEIKEQLAQCLAMLTELREMMEGAVTEEVSDEEAEPAQPALEMAAQKRAYSKGKAAGLEKRIFAMETERAGEKFARKAKDELSDRNIPDDFEEEVATIYNDSKQGPKAARKYVEAIRAYAPKVTTDDDLDLDVPADPPEVAEYGRQGPEHLEAARHAYRTYGMSKRHGKASLKTYIAVNAAAYLANGATAGKGA